MVTSANDASERLGAGALDRLDEVPWSTLHHAYGNAGDVPGDLEALRSADAEARHRAHANLRGSVYHQGTRWQASAHTVPFLVALVDDRATPERDLVLRLLRAVVVGDRDDSALPFDPAAEFALAAGATGEMEATVLEVLAAEDEFDEDLMDAAEAVAVRWDRDAYEAGAPHLDRYLAWTRDADGAVGAGAAELLVWYTTTPAARELVEAALLAVPDTPPIARASANLSLAHLEAGTAQPDGGTASRLTGLLAATDEAVALTAAVALAFRLGAAAPDGVIGPLASARDGAADPSRRLPDLPWSRSLLGFASMALRRIGLG